MPDTWRGKLISQEEGIYPDNGCRNEVLSRNTWKGKVRNDKIRDELRQFYVEGRLKMKLGNVVWIVNIRSQGE